MMSTLIYILIPLYALVCLVLIIAVLLQPGKGGGLGTGLGSGTSQQIFGGRGSTPFLEKLTIGLSIAFAVLTIGLGKAIHEQQFPKELTKKIEKLKKAQEAQFAAEQEERKIAEKAAEEDRKAKENNEKQPDSSIAPSQSPTDKPNPAKTILTPEKPKATESKPEAPSLPSKPGKPTESSKPTKAQDASTNRAIPTPSSGAPKKPEVEPTKPAFLPSTKDSSEEAPSQEKKEPTEKKESTEKKQEEGSPSESAPAN